MPTLRDWLNAVLGFISASSLTDAEYNFMNTESMTINVYNQASYDGLAGALLSREAVSTLQDQLIALFKAKGATVTPINTGKSNILLGAVL